MAKPRFDVIKRNEAFLVDLIKYKGRLPVTTTSINRLLQLLIDRSYYDMTVGFNYTGKNGIIISHWKAFRQQFPSPRNNNIGAFINHFLIHSGKAVLLFSAVDNVIARSKWSNFGYDNILTNYVNISRETPTWKGLPLMVSKLNSLGWWLGPPQYKPSETRRFGAWTSIQLGRARLYTQYRAMRTTATFSSGDTRHINNWLSWINGNSSSGRDSAALMPNQAYMSRDQLAVWRTTTVRTVAGFLTALQSQARSARELRYRTISDSFSKIYNDTDTFGTPTPVGPSADMLSAAFTYSNDVSTRIQNLNREFGTSKNLLVHLVGTTDKQEPLQQQNLTYYTSQLVMLQERYIDFLNKASDTFERFVTQYTYKKDQENQEKEITLALTIFSALAAIGSVGFGVSNFSATIRQYASSSSIFQFVTGNLGASFGSVTLFANNSLLAAVNNIRYQRVDQAYSKVKARMAELKLPVSEVDTNYKKITEAMDRYQILAERLTLTILRGTDHWTRLREVNVTVKPGENIDDKLRQAGIVPDKIVEASGYALGYWKHVYTRGFGRAGTVYGYNLYGVSSNGAHTINGPNSAARTAELSADVANQDSDVPEESLGATAYSERLAALVVEDGASGHNFTSLSSSKAKFDPWGAGAQQSVAWVGPRTGLLAFDKESDGIVGDFDEVDFTKTNSSAQTVLEALRVYDTNGNNLLDAGDADWRSFGLWTDANGDGVGQKSEFKSLAQHNIQTISLLSDGKSMASNTSDVQIHGSSQIRRNNGTTAFAREVSFRVDWDNV